MPGFNPQCYRVTTSGVLLVVRVTPNARRDLIEGVERRDNGEAVLRLRVKDVPDKGKANRAVAALLAKTLGLAKSAITVVSGQTARLKTLAITGDSTELAARIKALPLL